MDATTSDGKPRHTATEAHLDSAQRAAEARRLPGLLLSAMRLTWQANRSGFIMAAVLQIIGAVVVSAFVLVGKSALDGLLAIGQGGESVHSLIPVVAVLVVITAGGSAAGTLQQQQQRLVTEDLTNVVWDRVLDVTARIGLEFYESPRFHDQLMRIQMNAFSQPMAVTGTLFGLIGSTVGISCLLIVLLAIEPWLVPVLLLAGVPAMLIGRRVSGLEFRFVTRTMPTFRTRNYLRGVLVGREEAKEVRAFGAERALRSRCAERARTFRSELRGHVRQRQRYAMGTVLANSAALGVTLGMLIWFLSIGRISLAGAAAAAFGVRMLSSGLDGVFRSITGLFQSAVFLTDLEAFFGLAVVAEGEGTGRPPAFRREIAVDSVSYTYPGSTVPAVDEVSLRIEPGEVVALVGENGSGKTTLAKLLAGLYPPASGRITWDGTDTAGLEPADVRRGVSVIFQDFVQYQLSALDNIGLGDPDHADDVHAARAAATRAGADGFLSALSAGYQTVLSREYENGCDLSVGQWQRIALARALRRDTPLVILDEPSSALDPRAEHALFEDVRRTLQGRAALLISHRYSTVRSADRIYVMRDGRIAESGSHDDLMTLGGLYSELFSLQAHAYR